MSGLAAQARWGTTIVRSQAGVPFKLYEPRPRALPEFLDEAARFGERDFVVEDAARWSFDAVRATVARGAAALAADGVGPGDRVALVAGNSAAWIVAFWSVLQTGATLVVGNAWWSTEELGYLVDRTAPRLVVTDAATEGRFAAGVPRLDVEA